MVGEFRIELGIGPVDPVKVQNRGRDANFVEGAEHRAKMLPHANSHKRVSHQGDRR